MMNLKTGESACAVAPRGEDLVQISTRFFLLKPGWENHLVSNFMINVNKNDAKCGKLCYSYFNSYTNIIPLG